MKTMNLKILLSLLAVSAASSAFAEVLVWESDAESTDVQPYSMRIGESHPEDYGCHDIYLSVVVKKSVVGSPVFDGIGFYSNFKIDDHTGPLVESPFFARSMISKSHPVTLATGEAAYLLEYSGRGYCWAGSVSSSMYQNVAMKPYARFTVKYDNGNRHVYRNWAPGENSWVGGKLGSNGYEMQSSFENRYLLK